jgi:hypothetical protein
VIGLYCTYPVAEARVVVKKGNIRRGFMVTGAAFKAAAGGVRRRPPSLLYLADSKGKKRLVALLALAKRGESDSRQMAFLALISPEVKGAVGS